MAKQINNLDDWCKAVFGEIKKNKKRIVLVAGASSSGKTVSSNKLAEYCNKNGIKAYVISADNYYKGLTENLTEKLFLKPEFAHLKDHIGDIVGDTRSVIEFFEYGKKFSAPNQRKIKKKLVEYISEEDAQNVIEGLICEHKDLSFDEPFAINFVSLVRDIKTLVKASEKKILVPHYSFATAEVTYYDNDFYPSKDTDVFIIEGLYVLRDELLSKIPNDDILCAAVDCDLKTILARKFNRDIKNSRSSLTPEMNIVMFLTKIMPSYYKYVLPTLSRAVIVFNSSLSQAELESKEMSSQIKYKAGNDIFERLEEIGAKRIFSEKHRDYFIDDKTRKDYNDIFLRLREVDGEGVSITIKVGKNTPWKYIDEYDLISALSSENRDINLLCSRFLDSGFDILHMLKKTREYYKYKDYLFTVDRVNNLGNFVEFKEENFDILEELVKKLKLSGSSLKSYIEIYRDNLHNLVKSENELKFLVDNFDGKYFAGKYPTKKVAQYYLDISNKDVVELIKKVFNGQVKSLGFSEARVRICNSSDASLTIKSDGGESRVELEIDFPLVSANQLIERSIGSVHKTRYELYSKNGLLAELDKYDNINLAVLEIEYDNKSATAEDAKDLAKTLLDKKFVLTDVTGNPDFKNKNLAKNV